MTIVRISKDEEYPVYSINNSSFRFIEERIIDISEEMKDRIDYIINEYNKIQDYIDYKIPDSYFNHSHCGFDHSQD